ncbi:hypothetical protein B0I35DRAFT_82469 [Stachybotrys elegans]|uniref:Methyltransferase type 11 domain-containing protein n=1 Tax=Stachybotrys elegans TaxID=80388 RepID=A0A8K0WLP3_9HYPO|nr:hypothetical protein B0I35DRAFT_82469 [Stachybotrys elegans]
MSSPRTGFGYGLPMRPDEGLRPKKARDPTSPSFVPAPRPGSRKPRSTSNSSETRPQATSKLRPPSRVLQNSPASPPPNQPLPQLKHRPARSAGSSTTTGSKSSFSHSQAGSASSSSSRSHETSLLPAHNVLRRKSPSVSHESKAPRQSSTRTDSSSSIPRSAGHIEPALGIQFDRVLTASPAEIQVAEVVEMQKPQLQTPYIYPELDRYRDYQVPVYVSDGRSIDVPFRLATHDLPPPTPVSVLYSGASSQMSAVSGSPSTRFSGSPGPGPYSRDTTPTSISSQSPGLIAPSRFTARGRQNSPAQTRPPVTKRRGGSFSNEFDASPLDPQGLAAVRESLTSSSSNSTVRDATNNKKHAKKLTPPAPSPPPRKSSQRSADTELSPRQIRPQLPYSSTARSPSPSKISGSSRLQQPSPSPVGSAPQRPSRDGAPDLHSQLSGFVPIVHSNLSTTSLPGERRGSEPVERPRPLGQSNLPPKNASTSHLPISRDTASPSKNLKINTDLHPRGSLEKPTVTRTPSPNVSATSTGRFPFFRRRKTAPEDVTAEKKEKDRVVRKGPAAGTGHEGYGRVGAIRRRSGSISQLTRGAPNASSQENQSPSDPFLAERLNPVVIAGGEIVDNRNPGSELSRTESNQSIPYGRPSIGSRMGSETSMSSMPGARTMQWQTSNPRASYAKPAARRPSDSSDSEGVTMKSTLAFRRSVQRSRSSPDDPLRLPRPIDTSGATSSPMTSFDTSVMSDDSIAEHRYVPNPHPQPKKLTKRTRSPRRWNLFGRSQNSADSKKKNEKAKPVAPAPPVEQKRVAFYAMVDSSDPEDGEILDIQEVLRNADVYMPSTMDRTPVLDSGEFQVPDLAPLATDLVPEPLSPLRPNRSLDIEGKTLAVPGTQSDADDSASGRPSRLAQVGRIPKVISNRPVPGSPMSFSRPFRASVQLPNNGQVPNVLPSPQEPEPAAQDKKAGKSPSPVVNHVSEGSTAESGTMNDSFLKPSLELAPPDPEFLSFSPRKNSASTGGTSSSPCSSATDMFAGSTAIIPRPNDPPAEDEIWDEYDDLLDGNTKVRVSTSSSHGVPFHLETYQSRLVKEKPMESPTIIPDSRKMSTHSRATQSTYYSADMTERIRAAFQPHPSPTASTSGHDEKPLQTRRSQSLDIDRKTVEEPKRTSGSSVKTSTSSCSSCSSEDDSPLAQVNLRVGSMTVSKWLTFGHVLFSEVRNDLIPVEGSLKRHSILVIDGLGNDDWSFYAAETYPAATFFNLSPRAPLPDDLQTSASSFPLSPPNHHQIQYVSHLEKFPFAPQSFTCVVYRFPVAAPESYYRNILTEARRVLKAGGYLELSILDVDLNNMGNRGRRTIRRLKERIHEETPDTSLASTADLIIRLLGKVGFSNIKAARVGVPVATAVNGKENAKVTEAKKRDQRSLADMMNENGPVADENITKMVSRVGRWWYTRCYESAAGSSQRSIWNDKALLRECEELGTSLKLMVCCARAPERITSV